MPIDFSFLQDAAPQHQEPGQKQYTGKVNVAIRVDTSCYMQCDGEYVDVQLKAGQVSKMELPTGQHLLEFLSEENPNVKVEKVVDFPESGKNYLIVINELRAAVAPPIQQTQGQQSHPRNPYLDQLNQTQWNNPLIGSVPPLIPTNNNK